MLSCAPLSHESVALAADRWVDRQPGPAHNGLLAVAAARRLSAGIGRTVALMAALMLGIVAPTGGEPLVFAAVAPGVWKAAIGTPEDLTLLSAAGAVPNTGALAAMPALPFPLPAGAIDGRLTRGNVALRFPLALDEDVYGLGVDFTSMRRTGSTFQLHVDHWGGRPGRTHAPVPFYVSTKGYGVLIDSSRYMTVSVGLGVRVVAPAKPPLVDRTTQPKAWSALPRSDAIEALVPAAGVDVYVFSGPTPMDAVRRYNLFGGGGACLRSGGSAS
jgi:hypothetical protein